MHTVLIGSPSFMIRQGLLQLLKSINVQFEVFEAETENKFHEQLSNGKPNIVLIDPHLMKDIHSFIYNDGQSARVVAGICQNSESEDNNIFDHCLFIYDSRDHLMNKLQQLTEIQNGWDENHSSELSEREIAILKKVALGYTNKEISEQLYISHHTVITHRKNITAKLGIKTIPGLTVYALINNLISTEDVNVG